MKKNIFYLFVALFLWLFIHTLLITIDGLNDNIENSDAAVVLGNKIELDGTPSKRLQSRLDLAVELYSKNYFDSIIVSGGKGKEGFDEAIVMKEYLVKNGIPDDVIVVDSNGYNSFATARNAKAILDNKKSDSVLIISQFYHITRTRLAFKKVGFEHVSSAHAKYFEIRDIYSLIREFFAYYKYLFMKVKAS